MNYFDYFFGNLFYTPRFSSQTFKAGKEKYSISVALPGCGKEDVEVVATDVLTVKSKGKDISFRLYEDMKLEEATATMDKGLLQISIPRAKKSVEAKKIPIS